MNRPPSTNRTTSYTASLAGAGLQHLAERQHTLARSGSALHYGFPSMDRLLPMIMPGDLILFHGMSGEFKSGFVHSVERNIISQINKSPLSEDGRRRVIVHAHSEEIVEILWAKMLLSPEITPRRVMDGTVNLDTLKRTIIYSGAAPIIFIGRAELSRVLNPISDSGYGALTADLIGGTIYDLLQDHAPPLNPGIKVELLVIDHMHDLHSSTIKSGSEMEIITAVDREIARLKDWLGAPMILVCQDNAKDIVKRDHRIPRREDIRYSNAVVTKAVTIFSIFKPSNGHVPLGEEITFLAPDDTTRTIKCTKDLILAELQKSRNGGSNVTIPFSALGSSRTWGDTAEINYSALPLA